MLKLFSNHQIVNFTLALFGFNALLDSVFNTVGLFETNVPVYGTVLLLICALPALWIAFSKSFGLGSISFFSALGSFIFGVLIELFFNYWSADVYKISKIDIKLRSSTNFVSGAYSFK